MRGKLTGEIKAAKMMRITPRTCGENFDGHDVAKIIVGSPPHMRGKLFRHLVTLCHHRITPAHAGKTLYCFEISPCKTDHPRTCGENVNHSFSLFRRGGSPPHMRGKRKFGRSAIARRRITPAHAGKTSMLIIQNLLSTDHPRTCGENAYWLHSDRSLCGSPPHMRGKRRFCGAPASIQRITPAHAGKTKALIAFSTTPTDHPRTCGENLVSTHSSVRIFGSPPHMRGKPIAGQHGMSGLRITPAHAGKTATSAMAGLKKADHPRTCGENLLSCKKTTPSDGSPPHMRGKRLASGHTALAVRITPAHAGKTCTL